MGRNAARPRGDDMILGSAKQTGSCSCGLLKGWKIVAIDQDQDGLAEGTHGLLKRPIGAYKGRFFHALFLWQRIYISCCWPS